MIVTVNPHKQLPANAPSAATDPIHDISIIVSLPVSNGDASERSNGNAIDTQPMAQPPANIIKFAAILNVLPLILLKLSSDDEKKLKIHLQSMQNIACLRKLMLPFSYFLSSFLAYQLNLL